MSTSDLQAHLDSSSRSSTDPSFHACKRLDLSLHRHFVVLVCARLRTGLSARGLIKVSVNPQTFANSRAPGRCTRCFLHSFRATTLEAGTPPLIPSPTRHDHLRPLLATFFGRHGYPPQPTRVRKPTVHQDQNPWATNSLLFFRPPPHCSPQPTTCRPPGAVADSTCSALGQAEACRVVLKLHDWR